MDLLDPKNDYVFKRLFADSPELLAALISAVRCDEPPVEVLQVLNPQILPEDLTGKAIELDVLARDSRGRLFNVEVQVQRFPRWSARSAFYLSRLLGSQIDAGQAYVNLKPVVGVHLLDFDLFDGHRSALWHFEMRDRHDPSVRLGDELSLHVVELRKADRLMRGVGDDGGAVVGGGVDPDADAGIGAGSGAFVDVGVNVGAGARPEAGAESNAEVAAGPATRPALKAWIAFLKRWKEGKEMSEVSYPPVQQAMKKLQALSRNEEDRYRAIARERALFNELTLLRDAREEGWEKGREEGQTLARIATLTRQLTRRFGPPPEWVLARMQQATGEQIDTWLDRILDAPSIDAVFDAVQR
jgi:hypothetical protein